MKRLGRIVRLQLQRSSLKRVADGRKWYDPAPLLSVDALTLTAGGALARRSDGSFLIDIHHAAHPHTRNNGGVNPLSFVFTPHYDRMRDRFGPHLTTGCAGESILIEGSALVSLADVAGGLVIESAAGPVTLGHVIVAEPCTPFSHFALGQSAASAGALKEVLQFLGQGTRGFYCQLTSAAPAAIAIGDEVFAATG